jgi:glycosyltransferase involved in cell wall biosynthesis
MRATYAIARELGGGGIGSIACHQARGLAEAGHLHRAYATGDDSNLDAVEVPPFGLGWALDHAASPFYLPSFLQDGLDAAGVPLDVAGSLSAVSEAVVPERAARYLRPSFGFAVKNWGFDRYVASQLDDPDVFVGWAAQCLRSLRRANAAGATTFVVRASSHIDEQKRLVEREYADHGIHRPLTDPWHVEMNRAEYEEADYVIVPSDFVEETFLDRGFDPDRLVKLPFGVDADQFTPGDPPDSFRAVFVGQVSLRKGIQYLLPAWDRLDRPDAELLVVGPVTDDARDVVEPYRDRDEIRFLGRRDDVPDLLADASAFVFPSIEEGSALVTYEAMAAGIPLVVTPNAGAWMTDGEEGFEVPVRDVEAITGRLETLAADPTRAVTMGRAARRRAEKLTWERHRERFAAACV